ncbi:MAG: response regulator [Campylobacterota bacterium]|nr:response regulator [Campylobacterota bacterium]
MGNLAVAGYFIQKNLLTNLKIKFKTSFEQTRLTLTIRKDWEILVGIFNKVLENISYETKNDILKKWLPPITYEKIIKEKIDYSLLWKVILVAFIVIVIFIYWNRKLSNLIREKEEVQRDLVQSEKRLQLALKGGDLGFWDINFKTKQLIVNQRWASMLGYSDINVEDLSYDFWKSTIYKDDLKKVLNMGLRYKNGEIKQYEIEYRAVTKNGDIIWILSKGGLVAKDKTGKALRMVGTVSDITLRKNFEKDLEEQRNKAQAATKAKSIFLAKMSHEIRIPMNAVLGMLYLVDKTSLTRVQTNYISKSRSAAESLLNLINDILDFSKIEAGKLDIEHIDFEINELLSKISSVMSFKAEDKGLEFLVRYDNQIPKYLIGDPTRIEQILINLIGNAIKFTSIGEVLVSSKLIGYIKNDITIMFCIKDSGIGISKDEQNKLFQEFSQVDERTTRKFGGTGLGLAISKKLTNMMGGKIWVEDSSSKGGSTFCFTIKCKVSKSGNEDNYLIPKKLNNINTLIVDDNKLACSILKEQLDSFKIDNKSVYSGEEAIDLIVNKKENFNLIFLDFKMDGLNGVETFQKLKELMGDNTPKTIMVTAYSQEELLDDIEQNGFSGFITKPVSPSVLYDSILYVLDDNIKNKKDEISKYDNISLNDIYGSDILLVEDNEINQEFATILLEQNHIKVDIANDGLEALKLIQSKKYDAILMDIQMPNMDGIEATKEIREKSNQDIYFKNIPIIAMTAHAMSDDMQKSLDAGMNDHITKPIDPDKFFEALLKYIKPKKDKESFNNQEKQNSNSIDIFNNLDNTTDIINIEEALKRVFGNQKAFYKILKKFQNNYSNFDKLIIDLIKQNKLIEAEKKVHELKGISGNISATKLYQHMILLDSILKKGDTPFSKHLVKLQEYLKEVLEYISNIKIDEGDDLSKEFDINKVKNLIDIILENLEKNIVLSNDALDELIPYLKDTKYEEFSKSLDEAISNFDTDSASQLIIEFKKDL